MLSCQNKEIAACTPPTKFLTREDIASHYYLLDFPAGRFGSCFKHT